jgi:hypothetical protein
MFFKLQPILYSLVFLFGLEATVFFRQYAFLIFFVLFIISLYQGKMVGKKWIFSVLPVFFTLSSAALLYLITFDAERQLFILLASSMYYLSLFGAYRLFLCPTDKTARGMNMAATASTIFFAFASAYGLYLNFLVSLHWLMLAYLLVALLVSYQHFSIINEDKRTAWVYSFILALVMAELIWVLNFWPFGYLTTGVIALILYYTLWDLVQSHFLNILSKKRVVGNLIFFSVMIGMILLSSKWTPVI